jgi:hypothetical protein
MAFSPQPPKIQQNKRSQETYHVKAQRQSMEKEVDELLFNLDETMIRLKIPDFHRKLVIQILMDMPFEKMREICKRESDALCANQAIIQGVHRSIRARENCLSELTQEIKKLESPAASAKPGTFLYEQIVNESISKVIKIFQQNEEKTGGRFLVSFSTCAF